MDGLSEANTVFPQIGPIRIILCCRSLILWHAQKSRPIALALFYIWRQIRLTYWMLSRILSS